MKLKPQKISVRFKNPHGITEIPLMRTAIPEKVLIGKSIEFFDDPEPCMIHRSAVQSRLFAELIDALEQSNKNPFPLSGALKSYLCADKETGVEIFY